ncbi:hypothetical protein HaLaN_30901, partial [Haematococcus lacustris]
MCAANKACQEGVIASDDEGSICGNGLSRVTFPAASGQAYWVVVEGYSFFDTRACGNPALTITTSPPAPPPANGWGCLSSPDFLYLLPSSEEGDRSITLDTFVYEYDFWNTVLYVIPTQDGTCGQCSGAIASDDDSSFWDNGLSRLTFTAKAGQAYWILVEGYSASDSTCNEDNRWNCKAAPDFLYLLPSSEEGDRSITLDTCSEEMATWDSILYVIPVQDGTCGQCS